MRRRARRPAKNVGPLPTRLTRQINNRATELTNTVTSSKGADSLDGGLGIDTVSLLRTTATAKLTFALGPDTVLLGDGTTATGFERVSINSGSGNDSLTGGALNDTLFEVARIL